MADVKIIFVGDIMCEPLMINATKKRVNDFSFVFENVKDIFSEADFVVGNLETPLAGKDAGYTNHLFSFNAPEEFADAVKAAGISLVTTANNHCLDRGYKGLLHTLDVLDFKGIPHIGTWRENPEDRKEAYYFEKNGIKIAVVTSTYGTNHKLNKCELPPEKLNQVNLLHKQTEPYYIIKKKTAKQKLMNLLFAPLPGKQKAIIKRIFHIPVNIAREDSFLCEETAAPFIDRYLNDIEIAKKNADVVIPYLHVGGQFNPEPGEFSKYVFRKTAECGCDAIIASHTHIVQKAEMINGVPAFYSIGNFSMSPNSYYLLHENLPDYGLAVNVYINKNGIEIITFTILKMVETNIIPLTVYPVDRLYSMSCEKEKLEIIKNVKQIHKMVTGRDITGEVIQREYILKH